MTNVLNKVMNLIKKTGDRCIVVSENNEDAYAIMSLDEYEKVALNRRGVSDLTEEQLLDKINRDIGVWKSQQDIAPKDVQAEIKPQVTNTPPPIPEGYNLANNSDILPEVGEWDLFKNTEDEHDNEDDEPYYFEKV